MIERLDFGRYKGAHLAAVPRGYLEWLAGNPTMRPSVRLAAQAELKSRAKPSPADGPEPLRQLSFRACPKCDAMLSGPRCPACKTHGHVLARSR